MSTDPGPPLSDEDLDRLARAWFAQARARDRAATGTPRRDAAVDPGPFDPLPAGDDGDGDGD